MAALQVPQNKSVAVLVRNFLEYPFSSDTVYQQGLTGIRESGVLDSKSEEEKDEIMRRSQIFYFNSLYAQSLTLEDIEAYELPQLNDTAEVTPSERSDPDAELRPLTFAELKALIEEGKTDNIPNNRHIPNILNMTPPSESHKAPRKKPWEITDN